MKQTLRSIANGMVVVAVLFAFLISGIRLLGFEIFGVLTGSMEPNYPTGSLIYVRAVEAGDLRVNDVITFSLTPNTMVTHRIVEVVPDENNPSIVRFRTKGDANNDVDASLVSAGNIVGKAVFCVPYLGYVARYIQQPPGLYVAIAVCAVMIAFVFFTDSDAAGEAHAKKRRRAKKGNAVLVRLVNSIAYAICGRPLIRTRRTRSQQSARTANARPVQSTARREEQRTAQAAPERANAQQQAGQQAYYAPRQYAQQGYTPQQAAQPYAQRPYAQSQQAAQPYAQRPYAQPQAGGQPYAQQGYPQPHARQGYAPGQYAQPQQQYPPQPQQYARQGYAQPQQSYAPQPGQYAQQGYAPRQQSAQPYPDAYAPQGQQPRQPYSGQAHRNN